MDLSSEFLPFASFLAGITGSLHCLGMCGGLVTASCDGRKDIMKYQVGRLLGYLTLGNIAFVIGLSFKGFVSFKWLPLFSGVLLGVLFIYWGIQSFKGKKAEIPMPGFLRKFYQYTFRKFATRAGSLRSFVVGLISILLPCGLLYGIMIAALALGDYYQILLSLLFFWIGTLPAMVGAPDLIKKVLGPFRKNLPKVYATLFIVIGLATIATRVGEFYPTKVKTISEKQNHQCH